jgi:hypothetical protein
MRHIFVGFIFMFSLSGCVTPVAPNDEYALAKSAIDAAKNVQAVRYSAGYWHQAEETYRQAKILYSNRDYEEARDLFIKARLAAEKAENSARLIRQKNGDIL